jgi:hypothetical protein
MTKSDSQRKRSYPVGRNLRGSKEMEAERMSIYEELRCERILRIQECCDKINKKILKSKRGKLSIFSDGRKVAKRIKKYYQD